MKIKHRNPKLHLNFLLITLFLVPTFYSCKDDLPKETLDGRNTFGMLVNGEKWEPSWEGLVSKPNPYAIYNVKSKVLYISTYRKKYENGQVKNIEQFVFSTGKIDRPGNFSFLFNKYENQPSVCSDSTSFQFTKEDCVNFSKLINVDDGEVILTKFDTIKRIVSGRFKIKLFNRAHITTEITEGRFDLEFNF